MAICSGLYKFIVQWIFAYDSCFFQSAFWPKKKKNWGCALFYLKLLAQSHITATLTKNVRLENGMERENGHIKTNYSRDDVHLIWLHAKADGWFNDVIFYCVVSQFWGRAPLQLLEITTSHMNRISCSCERLHLTAAVWYQSSQIKEIWIYLWGPYEKIN